MEHTQKMYLVPQQQLDMLKHQQQETPGSIRQLAQNELDKAMVEVLELSDMDVHEKAKKYGNILQRYLSLVRQGEREKGILTLSTPVMANVDASVSTDTPASADGVKDTIAEEVLRHIPKRSRRNAEHILASLSRSSDVVSWTDQGEVIINNQPIKGSHLFDLIKSITAVHNVSQLTKPVGWELFLKSLASLNVPLSTIRNTQVRRSLAELKGVRGSPSDTGVNSHAGVKRKRTNSPSFSASGVHKKNWLNF